MANHPSPTYLDPQLSSLLERLRSRIRRYVFWESVVAASAVILGAFWIGLLLDYGPVLLGGTEMPRSARTVLFLVVVGILAVLVWRLLIARWRRPLPDDSLALLLERQHPQLAGRLVTAVQLGDPRRKADSHAPALLQRVHREAAAEADQIDERRVLRPEPLRRKVWMMVPLLAAAGVLLAVSPSVFGRASARLLLLSDQPWPRSADLQMVGLEIPAVTARQDDTVAVRRVPFTDGVARIGKGADATLRIRARAEGAIVPDVCTLYYRTADGTRGQANLRRVGRVVDGFQDFVLDGPPLSGLASDLRFSVRGLDDRLDDFEIQTVPPPALSQLKVIAYYPEYLRTDRDSSLPDRTIVYQPGLRLREGSDVQLVATATKPLSPEVDILVTHGEQTRTVQDFEMEPDGRTFRFSISDLRAPTSVAIVPRDRQGIDAEAPFQYFLGVVTDDPPEIEMRLSGIDTAITPVARLPVEGTIRDDYGVDAAEVSVVPADDPDPRPTTQPVQPDRDGEFDLVLDLRALVTAGRLAELQPGGAINVFGEAADAYDLGPEHLARSEVYRLQIVTADQLLALLERRELALRARLEQIIDETRTLRDSLDQLRRQGWPEVSQSTAVQTPPSEEASDGASADPADDGGSGPQRQLQILRLRLQQASLQTNKAREELEGLANSVDDLLAEMANNRVDSIDRSERLGQGVAQPVRQVVVGPLDTLAARIAGIQQRVERPEAARQQTALAVESADEVLLQLTAVLEKMLDLESYNEILDLVRSLLDSQEDLIEDTQEERNERIRDLFQ